MWAIWVQPYRNGAFGYPYYGTIDSVRVYDTALAQDVLEAETYIEKDSGIIRQENVFSFEDWNTEGIRIPSILRTDKGTIICHGRYPVRRRRRSEQRSSQQLRHRHPGQ